jgi:type VII secretion integral membrane protein EccD
LSTAYSRVTVVHGARRVDLALPSTLPLSDVLPQLLGYCAPESRPERPAGWALARLGGTTLRLADTLADAGVTDGEVLELRTGSDRVRPAYVEDVRDAVEDTMDETAPPWQPGTTVSFALVTAGAGLGLVALLPAAREPRAPGALLAAALVAALLVAAGWWAGRRGQPRVGMLLVAVATGWGGVGGGLAASFPDWPPAAVAGAAAAGAALVAAVARTVTPVATAHLAGLSLLAAAGLATGATALAGLDPRSGVRVAGVAAVLLVGVLPRVSLTIGGLASADYRVRQHGLVTGEELARRVDQSNALLYGGLLGAAVLGAASGVLLVTVGSGWDRLLAVAVGAALVLRSRVFSRIPQIVLLRLAGLLVLAVAGAATVAEMAALRPWTVPLAAAVATGTVAAGAVPLSEVARARVRQLLDRAELVAVAAVVTLAAAALGWFGWVATLAPS